MENSIGELIQACEWLPSQFLVISENVYTPFLYYTYLGSAIPALLIGIFIFIRERNNLASRLLLLTVLAFSLWVFGSLVTWATEFPSYVMFFWTMVDVVEPFVYFFAFYFAYSYIYKRDLGTYQKLLFSMPLIPTIVLAPTPLMLIGFDLSNCDRNAFEGFLALYGYVIEILYVFLILGYSFAAFKNEDVVPRKNRKPFIIFVFGVTAFLTAFSLGNILELVTENWYIGQYGLLGAPVFTALLAYLIVKFEAFNIKMFSVQAFLVAIFLLVFSLLFIKATDDARIVVAITLALMLAISRSLLRSVGNEIAGRMQNAKLATDLSYANNKLRDLDRTKSEFVSIASHQLRTPLTAVRGFAELMRDGSYGPVPQRFLEPLSHIEESIQNMATSISDFLNVSRIESGTMKYELTSFSLRELVERVVGELHQYAQKRHLELIFKTETSSDLIINADEGKVRQILQNLIDNSIKYTPTGTVSVIINSAPGNKASVMIVDTGIGMSETTLKAIFDKFVRASNTNTANTYGTGLGLFIAREMAEAMKGKVTAASWGEGKGSTFTLELPLAVK